MSVDTFSQVVAHFYLSKRWLLNNGDIFVTYKQSGCEDLIRWNELKAKKKTMRFIVKI